jgi:hypothetical protein
MFGYSFKSSLKECFQLSQNIFKDVLHPSFIKRLEKKKVTNSSKRYGWGKHKTCVMNLM